MGVRRIVLLLASTALAVMLGCGQAWLSPTASRMETSILTSERSWAPSKGRHTPTARAPSSRPPSFSPRPTATSAHPRSTFLRLHLTSKSKLYKGTFHADPLYNQSQSDPHDIAVVIFERPIQNIEPARLPTLRQFDSVAYNQQFTAVGYGGREALASLAGM